MTEIEQLRAKLEYAYRVIERGYVHGTFDFSILRTEASNYLAELEAEEHSPPVRVEDGK